MGKATGDHFTPQSQPHNFQPQNRFRRAPPLVPSCPYPPLSVCLSFKHGGKKVARQRSFEGPSALRVQLDLLSSTQRHSIQLPSLPHLYSLTHVPIVYSNQSQPNKQHTIPVASTFLINSQQSANLNQLPLYIFLLCNHQVHQFTVDFGAAKRLSICAPLFISGMRNV